jgi:membrane fusion protein (multidrug efflux system)
MTPTSTGSATLRLLGSVALFAAIGAIAFVMYSTKMAKVAAAQAAAQQQPEHSETVTGANATTRSYARTTTAIGTARALRSITLRNELPGSVRTVSLETGKLVAEGELLVELDVTVETAELAAYQAESRLAESFLARVEQAQKNQGASAADVDRARAERDKAIANVARLQAQIERKRLRAPFAARTGLVDLHPGQYLEPGTTITTLQGLDEAIHVDFAVTQEAALLLTVGAEIDVKAGVLELKARITALDARVEADTRNARVRARLDGKNLPTPGSSMRVRVPVEAPHDVVVVPVSALRRGPGGDVVYALEKDASGALRARTRRVQSGAVLGDEVVIREGIANGERVAAAGSFKLMEGVLVHDVPAAAPQQAK